MISPAIPRASRQLVRRTPYRTDTRPDGLLAGQTPGRARYRPRYRAGLATVPRQGQAGYSTQAGTRPDAVLTARLDSVPQGRAVPSTRTHPTYPPACTHHMYPTYPHGYPPPGHPAVHAVTICRTQPSVSTRLISSRRKYYLKGPVRTLCHTSKNGRPPMSVLLSRTRNTYGV